MKVYDDNAWPLYASIQQFVHGMKEIVDLHRHESVPLEADDQEAMREAPRHPVRASSPSDPDMVAGGDDVHTRIQELLGRGLYDPEPSSSILSVGDDQVHGRLLAELQHEFSEGLFARSSDHISCHQDAQRVSISERIPRPVSLE